MIAKAIILIGLIIWISALCLAVYSVDLKIIFALILGGQLVKFGWTSIKERMRYEWQETIVSFIENNFKKQG